MITNTALLDTYEKATQEFMVETWEYFWTLTGQTFLLICVCFGIYFSQYGISSVFGVLGLMWGFGWTIAIVISSFEVAIVTMFANDTRRKNLWKANPITFCTVAGVGVFIVIFDFYTNYNGLWMVAHNFAMSHGMPISIFGHVCLWAFSLFCTVAEVLVGFFFRTIATHATSWGMAFTAWKKYSNDFKRQQRNTIGTNSPIRQTTSQFHRPAYVPPVQPQQEFPVDTNQESLHGF